jgi:hypothetical protein
VTLLPTLETGGAVSNTLTGGAAVIYTAASGVMVKDLRYICTANAPQTIQTYLTKLGQTRELVAQGVLSQGWRQVLPEKGQTWCLNTGDIIEAVTTTSASVTWDMSDLVSA